MVEEANSIETHVEVRLDGVAISEIAIKVTAPTKPAGVVVTRASGGRIVGPTTRTVVEAVAMVATMAARVNAVATVGAGVNVMATVAAETSVEVEATVASTTADLEALVDITAVEAILVMRVGKLRDAVLPGAVGNGTFSCTIH